MTGDTTQLTLSPKGVIGTIGIIGGGQLGRMLALAAAELGLKTHIYCPETNSSSNLANNFKEGVL